MNIGKDIVVHEHKKNWKIWARFVSHILTNDQKQTRVETFGDFIDMSDRNPQFFGNHHYSR